MMYLKSTFKAGKMIFQIILISLLVLALQAVDVFGQSGEEYDAILQMVGAEKYNQLNNSRPEALAELAYMNRNGYQVSDAGEKDFADLVDALDFEPLYQAMPAVTLEALENGTWNMYGYLINPDAKQYLHYRIGESNKILVILPVDLVRKKMNN
jgi:hypothetical protein